MPTNNTTLEKLLWLSRSALDWIDAVPSDTLLPVMPGFDRDEAEAIIAEAKGAIAKTYTNRTLAKPGWYWFVSTNLTSMNIRQGMVTVDQEAIDEKYLQCPHWDGTFTGPVEVPTPTERVPEIADTTEIEIVRPVTKRDRQHAKDTFQEKFLWPRIGDHTRGFWTEEEAKEYAIRWFKQWFKPGWALQTHDEDGKLVIIATT